MWYKESFFKYITGFILVLLTIFLLGQVSFVLTPLKNALMVVSLPLVITLLFYYLLRPLVRLLVKHRLSKILSILVCFIATIGLLILLVILAGNPITNEFNQLVKELPRVLKIAEDTLTDLINSGNLDILLTENSIEKLSNFIEKTISVLGEGLFSGISTAISTVTALLLVPFILFYFLKDDRVFARNAINLFPDKYKNEAKDIIVDIDNTLSSYITGQALICLVIGFLMYVGYLIIGLEYALVLALFSMFTAVVPFAGPIIGVIPALLIGLSYNFLVIVKILIIMVLVQQLEGTLITPQIMGKRIQTHPITIIMVLLVSASLFGFVGILLAIPSYAVLKVFIKNGIKTYKIINREKKTAA